MNQSPRKEWLATVQHRSRTVTKTTAACQKRNYPKEPGMGKSQQICQIVIYLLFWAFLRLCISGANLVGSGGSNPLNKKRNQALHAFLRRGRRPEENISRAIVSQIFILLISNEEKILSNVNAVVWGKVKSENSSLPVAVRTSKTRVFKLPVREFKKLLRRRRRQRRLKNDFTFYLRILGYP